MLCFLPWGKCRQTAVKAQRQQLIAVRRGIHGAKTKFFGKGLIGKPGLLFFCPQHTNAGFSLLFCLPQTIFHQLSSVAFSICPALHPEAVDIQIIFPYNRHPGRFQRSIFDEYTVFPVQLSKNMPFFQPIAQLFLFCLHSGMRLFRADDAA